MIFLTLTRRIIFMLFNISLCWWTARLSLDFQYPTSARTLHPVQLQTSSGHWGWKGGSVCLPVMTQKWISQVFYFSCLFPFSRWFVGITGVGQDDTNKESNKTTQSQHCIIYPCCIFGTKYFSQWDFFCMWLDICKAMHWKATPQCSRVLAKLLSSRHFQQKVSWLKSEMDDQHLDDGLALMRVESGTAKRNYLSRVDLQGQSFLIKKRGKKSYTGEIIL